MGGDKEYVEREKFRVKDDATESDSKLQVEFGERTEEMGQKCQATERFMN